MKEQLAKLKSEIARKEKLYTEADEEVKRLARKSEEMTGKLTGIDGALSAAEENQDAAVTRFARGEISEDKLDKALAPIPSLNAKKTAITRSLDVVNADLSAAEETREDISKTLGELKRKAWALISELELSRAAVPLRRAFVALGMSQGADATYDSAWQCKKDFLKSDEVYQAVFHSGPESYEMASELLDREYLK